MALWNFNLLKRNLSLKLIIASFVFFIFLSLFPSFVTPGCDCFATHLSSNLASAAYSNMGEVVDFKRVVGLYEGQVLSSSMFNDSIPRGMRLVFNCVDSPHLLCSEDEVVVLNTTKVRASVVCSEEEGSCVVSLTENIGLDCSASVCLKYLFYFSIFLFVAGVSLFLKNFFKK